MYERKISLILDYDADDWYDDDDLEGELGGKKNVIFVLNWIEGQGWLKAEILLKRLSPSAASR